MSLIAELFNSNPIILESSLDESIYYISNERQLIQINPNNITITAELKIEVEGSLCHNTVCKAIPTKVIKTEIEDVYAVSFVLPSRYYKSPDGPLSHKPIVLTSKGHIINLNNMSKTTFPSLSTSKSSEQPLLLSLSSDSKYLLCTTCSFDKSSLIYSLFNPITLQLKSTTSSTLSSSIALFSIVAFSVRKINFFLQVFQHSLFSIVAIVKGNIQVVKDLYWIEVVGVASVVLEKVFVRKVGKEVVIECFNHKNLFKIPVLL